MDGADFILSTETTVYKCNVIWRINNVSFFFRSSSHPGLKSPSFSATNNTSYPWSLVLLHRDENEYGSYGRYNEAESRVFLQGTCTFKGERITEPLLATCKTTFYNSEKLQMFTSEHHATNFVEFDITVLKSKTFPKDELEIHCQISFVLPVQATTSIQNPHCCMSKDNIMEDLQKLFNNKDHSDVEIYIGERKFSAHKAILSVRSTILEAMFAHPMKENLQNRIDITDIKIDVFEEVLRYIYTGNVNNLETLAFELFAAGDKYNIKGLKCLCENAICSSISIETVINILCFSKTYNMKRLKTQAMNYLKQHGSEVINLPVWNDISSQPDVMKTIAESLLKRTSAQMEVAKQDIIE